jgi:hypothetical protein
MINACAPNAAIAKLFTYLEAKGFGLYQLSIATGIHHSLLWFYLDGCMEPTLRNHCILRDLLRKTGIYLQVDDWYRVAKETTEYPSWWVFSWQVGNAGELEGLPRPG